MAAQVQDNMLVQLTYTLTVDGRVVDTTEGRDAFNYVHGRGQLISGLERQLRGLEVGTSREIVVKPDEAYGQVDPTAFVEVDKAQLPDDLTPAVGQVLRGTNPEGKEFRATISEINPESVTLNLNHPLAGKTLMFTVTVTEVVPAPGS